MQDDSTESQAPAYTAPTLTVYGRFAEVTASGNSGRDECGNRGKRKACRS